MPCQLHVERFKIFTENDPRYLQLIDLVIRPCVTESIHFPINY